MINGGGSIRRSVGETDSPKVSFKRDEPQAEATVQEESIYEIDCDDDKLAAPAPVADDIPEEDNYICFEAGSMTYEEPSASAKKWPYSTRKS